MQVDPEYLREHYSLLSDEALLEVDRGDLVDVARRFYDDEISRRGLSKARALSASLPGRTQPQNAEPEEDESDRETSAAFAQGGDVDTGAEAEERPAWIDEASEVYSYVIRPGVAAAPDAANARQALREAGIPCYLEEHVEEHQPVVAGRTHRLRLMVPGAMNMHATSVLERDIFNPDFESEWRTHLEELSDAELRGMHPEDAFCGLFDRIERVTRAYHEELARRGLK